MRYLSHSDKEEEAERVRYASHSAQKIAADKQHYQLILHMQERQSAMTNRYTRCRSSMLHMRKRAYIL